MRKTLEIRVTTKRIPLSRTSIQALCHLERYDVVAFTSKNAKRFFDEELKRRRLAYPRGIRVVQVGPRNDLLKQFVTGKRILFPRSDLAPYDIVRKLRAKGAVVRAIHVYTTHGVPLTRQQKKSLLKGEYKALYFKSPSGVSGLLKQLRKGDVPLVLSISALCIGATTAKAAREAGFKRISIKAVL